MDKPEKTLSIVAIWTVAAIAVIVLKNADPLFYALCGTGLILFMFN